MDKKLLKEVIAKLSRQDEIVVNFRNDMQNMSGNFTVVNVTKGKGKGGSLLMELLNKETNQTLVTGTPKSDDILNVVYNGEMFGYTSEDDVPMVFVPEKDMAANIKKMLKESSLNSTVLMSSDTMQEFNGEFILLDKKISKGRGGQIIATLKNVQNNSKVEFWSYRHSGVVQKFEMVQ